MTRLRTQLLFLVLGALTAFWLTPVAYAQDQGWTNPFRKQDTNPLQGTNPFRQGETRPAPFSPPQASSSQESPSQRSWPPPNWSHSALGGYLRAVDDNKILIVLVEDTECPWCTRIHEEIQRDPRFVSMQSRVVFASAQLNQDDDKGNNQKLANDLQVDRVPSILVLKVGPGSIKEINRIIGFFPAEELIRRIEEYLH